MLQLVRIRDSATSGLQLGESSDAFSRSKTVLHVVSRQGVETAANARAIETIRRVEARGAVRHDDRKQLYAASRCRVGFSF